MATLGVDPAPAPAAPLSAYMTAADLARELRCHKATVYRVAKAHPDMPQLVLGNVIRFPRERVLAWLRRREGRPVLIDVSTKATAGA